VTVGRPPGGADFVLCFRDSRETSRVSPRPMLYCDRFLSDSKSCTADFNSTVTSELHSLAFAHACLHHCTCPWYVCTTVTYEVLFTVHCTVFLHSCHLSMPIYCPPHDGMQTIVTPGLQVHCQFHCLEPPTGSSNNTQQLEGCKHFLRRPNWVCILIESME
jgi:hypothetical protein